MVNCNDDSKNVTKNDDNDDDGVMVRNISVSVVTLFLLHVITVNSIHHHTADRFK